jgi:hypothetical protein
MDIRQEMISILLWLLGKFTYPLGRNETSMSVTLVNYEIGGVCSVTVGVHVPGSRAVLE